jgi:hypothetical protein
MFVDADRAKEAAAQQIRSGPAAGEPAFHQWREADAGPPVLVRDNAGHPSYWLVPVVRKGETVGLVRVLPDGRASASVALRGGPAITSMSAEDARRRCEGEIDWRRGETPGDALLVHDGPAGREAWRVEVVRAGQPQRWIFVTAGGSYERPAGATTDDQTRE